MFILILSLGGTLLNLYFSWHVIALPWFQAGRRRRIAWRISFLLWSLYVLGSLYGHGNGGVLASWLERFAMDWLGALFIGSVVMLGVDLLCVAGFRFRRYHSLLRGGGLVLAVLLVCLALIQGYRSPGLTHYEVSIAGLPQQQDGMTVAVLSDLHLGSQLGVEWMRRRVAQVQAVRPDLIVLLGDNFEGHGDPDPVLEPVFAALQAPLGVYAVTGNHEHFGDYNAAMMLTEKAGIRWLRDSWLELRPGLVLAGVDDLTIRWRRGKAEDFVSPLLVGAPPGATILLSHSPLQVEQAAAAGVDLMLSGHNHDGQIWPFGYLVERFYPYLKGLHNVDGMTLIVSRGTGLWGPRMRLWQPGEILVVTLRTP